VFTETVLLPFKDTIIYDGLLNSYNISFGPGYRRDLNETYKEAKQRIGIVTSLPIKTRSIATKKSTKRPTRKK
jgi:hypothetical protein